MPEEMNNAAVSGEWKPVPMAQLKKWHRDMDACQKVMWLRGGFDPAYCMDAQDCLKEMEGVLATALPPYGPAPKVHRYSVVKMLSEDGNKIDYKPHGPSVVMADVHDAHVTRLQAENAALQQRLTIADQRVDDLQHQQSQSLEVNPHSLRVVLTALVGAPHEIRELQACRGIPDNPIDQLLREYNAWIEKPTPATPQ